MAQAITPGTNAPDFVLPTTPDQSVSLSDFRGRPVILAFYPAGWSPVCGDQVALYNEIRGEFARHGAQLLGISVDGVDVEPILPEEGIGQALLDVRRDG